MTKFEDKFPQGKLAPDDEGVLEIRMGFHPKAKGKFIIHFGKPVPWIGMSKEEAVGFATKILRMCADSVVTMDIPD